MGGIVCRSPAVTLVKGERGDVQNRTVVCVENMSS